MRLPMVLMLFLNSALSLPLSLEDGTDKYCGLGEFLDRKSMCQTCPNDTYMDSQKHQNSACIPCVTYSEDIDHVIEVEPCTRQRKTIIKKCSEGYVVYESTWDYECRQKRHEISPTGSLTSPAPTATPGTQTTVPVETPTTSDFNQMKYFNCNDVIKDTEENRCFRKEYANKSCSFHNQSSSLLLPCQSCLEIVHNNVPLCHSVQAGEDPEFSKGAIAGIVFGILVPLVSAIIVGVYCWRTKKCRRVGDRVYNIANNQIPAEDLPKAGNAHVKNGANADAISREADTKV